MKIMKEKESKGMRKNNVFKVFLVLALSLVLTTAFQTQTKAEEKATLKSKEVYTFIAPNNGFIFPVNWGDSQLVKVTASKKGIIRWDQRNITNCTNWRGSKKGTTVLTYTLKSKSGVKYQLKQKFIVVTDCPFASLKFGNKNVTSDVKKGNHFVDIPNRNAKVTWKISSKYKLVECTVEGNGKKFKNNDTLKKSDSGYMHFVFKDNKGHLFHYYLLCVNR